MIAVDDRRLREAHHRAAVVAAVLQLLREQPALAEDLAATLAGLARDLRAVADTLARLAEACG